MEAARWVHWMDETKDAIRLIDFGGAFHSEGPRPEKLNQPAEFRAPETLLTETLDWRVDLWSVGITVGVMCSKKKSPR